MNNVEASKATQSIKQKLREMSRLISPEMHAFTRLHLPKVCHTSFGFLKKLDSRIY